jgi:transcriptional regulator, MarR family
MTMKHNEIRNALYPDCPVRNVLSRVGDKWSMLVLFTLEGQPSIRFKELQRSIPDISQKILTATLKMLEADGLINREVFPEVPPRVEYSLTEKGKSLLPLIDALLSWATDNMEDIIASRTQFYLK